MPREHARALSAPTSGVPDVGRRMTPKSGNRFSDKVMRETKADRGCSRCRPRKDVERQRAPSRRPLRRGRPPSEAGALSPLDRAGMPRWRPQGRSLALHSSARMSEFSDMRHAKTKEMEKRKRQARVPRFPEPEVMPVRRTLPVRHVLNEASPDFCHLAGRR
jgi:hypothetical protein